MKKFLHINSIRKTIVLSLLLCLGSFQIQAQNLVTNGDFESGVINDFNNVEGWDGFNHRIMVDNDTDERTGQINANEGSFFQVFSVVPEETYDFSFDYKWLNNAQPNMNMTVRVRNEATNDNIASIPLGSDEGNWVFNENIEVTVPTGVTEIRIQFFKGANNKPIRIDNVVFEPQAGLPCEPPTSVTNSSIATEAASFTWNSAPSELNGYDWAVVEIGDDPDVPADLVTNGSVSTGVLRAVVSGLTENTNYQFYVRTKCDGTDVSDWSAAVAFTPSFQENLITNSRFTLDGISSSFNAWEGFNRDSRKDNLNGDFVGYIDNDGTLRQDVQVVPGVEYVISFNYRWLDTGRVNGNDITPQVRNPNVGGGAGILETLTLSQNDSDVWYSVHYTYTLPLSEGIDEIRLQFFKGVNRNQLHISNVSILENIDLSSVADYVYKNGAWAPTNPAGVATSADNVYIFNGSTEITSDIEANNLEIEAWADVDISAVLDLTGTLTANGKVSFKNDDVVLGQLAAGDFTGKVMIERYNSAKRAFRLVSPAVDSEESIFHNWQEGGTDFIANLGTHITGSASGVNGFDVTETGNASLFTYDNAVLNQASGAAWTAISNTDVNTLEAGKLYRIYVRGDRSIDLTDNQATPNQTRLRAYGTLRTGNQTTGVELPALSSEDGNFSAVGNPYQAIVNAETITFNGDVNDNFVYVWAATESTNGQFVTLTVDGSSAPNPSTTDASLFIMPGQGFFIKNNATVTTSPSITFTEASKATEQPQVEIFSESEPQAYLNLRLYKTDDLDEGLGEVDAIGFRFDEGFTNVASDEDATKLGNPKENLAIINEGLLSIDNRNIPVHDETIELFVNSFSALDYSFQAFTDHLPENTKVYLEDNYTGESLELQNETIYNFSVDNSISESSVYNRFQIRFDVETLSTEEFLNQTELSLYPNPVQNQLSFALNNSEQVNDIQIYNQLGKLVKSFNKPEKLNFDVSQLQSGVYFIQLSTETTKYTSKFIKK